MVGERLLSILFWITFVKEIKTNETGKVPADIGTMTLQYREIMDQDGNYSMLWTPLKNEIIIEIEVATQGYVGIGFSPTGGMKGADIVLGWVDDATGELRVHDRHAFGKMIPMIDDKQDISVIGGYQNDSHTVFRFSRPWNTCDEDHDIKLSGDTTRLIWSYSHDDPQGDMDMAIHDQRGAKSMNLREPRFNFPTFSDDVKSVDMVFKDVRVPNDLDTIYWCQIFKFPNLKEKHHMIGFIPVIEEGNREHVHHMVLNECHLSDSALHYEKWVDAGARQCYSTNMPPTWYRCISTIIAWAVGSKGVIDNSGLRIFYTNTLRKMDGGTLSVMAGTEPTMIIPPGQHWKITGTCPGDCTNHIIPQNGIRIFAGLLHTHLLGRGITLKQIRNGVELSPIFEDRNYDFNYQQQRSLNEERLILPGDSLIVECSFDSRERKKTTFGGDGTKDEMCATFLSYYPRVNFGYCGSWNEFSSIYKPLGISDIYRKEQNGQSASPAIDTETFIKMDEKVLREPKSGFRDLDLSLELKAVVLKSPIEWQNKTLYDLVNNETTWKNSKHLADLQHSMIYDSQVSHCRDVTGKLFEGVPTITKYPEFIPFVTSEECTTQSKEQVLFDGSYVGKEMSGGYPKEPMFFKYQEAARRQQSSNSVSWSPPLLTVLYPLLFHIVLLK